jgi:hypothetical protein
MEQSLLVPDELILQATLKRAGSGSSCCGDLNEVQHDGVVEPRMHGAIHATPMRIDRDIIDDVIGKFIHAEGVEEEGLPLIVVQQEIVEVDGDECFDVEDRDLLHVKRGDDGLHLRLSINGQG